MANDILNTAGTTSGNQNRGTVHVKTSGSTRPNGTKKSTTHPTVEETLTVASIAAKYDARFDDFDDTTH